MAFVANSGTLILLANEERGIVVGSDSRSSGGRAKDDEVKVVEMGPWTLAAVRGKAALYDPDDPNRSFLVVERRLPQISRFTAHIRAGDDGDQVARIVQVEIV